ncbi:MAG: VWA domain-containing protein [Planctomycetes bacterium]|nr:VWA domain-containing protein [Planctomycetota bacterium]
MNGVSGAIDGTVPDRKARRYRVHAWSARSAALRFSPSLRETSRMSSSQRSGLAFASALVLALGASAQQDEAFEYPCRKQDAGFPPIQVIVNRPGAVLRQAPRDDAPIAQDLAVMDIFHVFPAPGQADADFYLVEPAEGEWWYRVHPDRRVSRGTQAGYLRSRDCIEWWHRQGVAFAPRGSGETARGKARIYREPEDWRRAYTERREEHLRDELAIAFEPMDIAPNRNILPVLGSLPVRHPNGAEMQLFKVAYIPANREGAATGGAVAEELLASFEKLPIEIVFCMDSSTSTEAYFGAVAQALIQASARLKRVDSAFRDRFRFGLVTYTGRGADAKIRCDLDTGANVEIFLERLRGVRAEGGAPFGEDMIPGLLMALGRRGAIGWLPRSVKIVIVIGDEPAFAPDFQPSTAQIEELRTRGWIQTDADLPKLNSSGLSIYDVVDLAQEFSTPAPSGETLELPAAVIDEILAAKTISAIEIDNPEAPEMDANLRGIRSSQFAALAHGRRYEGLHLKLDVKEVDRITREVLDEINRNIDFFTGLAKRREPSASGGTQSAMSELFRSAPEQLRTIFEANPDFIDALANDSLKRVQEGWIPELDFQGRRLVDVRYLAQHLKVQMLASVLADAANALLADERDPQRLLDLLLSRATDVASGEEISVRTPMWRIAQQVAALPIKTELFQKSAMELSEMTGDDRRRAVEDLQRTEAFLRGLLDERTDGFWFDWGEAGHVSRRFSFVPIEPPR